MVSWRWILALAAPWLAVAAFAISPEPEVAITVAIFAFFATVAIASTMED